MGNLAAVLSAQGDWAGARKLHEETLAIPRRALGPEHPDTLTSMNNLGVSLRAKETWRRRASLTETLDVRRRCWGRSTRIRFTR